MKKKLLLLSLISLIVTLTVITDTYGLFETNKEIDKELDIGKWKIVLNNNDISLAKSITLNDFVYTNNNHTEEGYFSPGESATFDIIIDSSLSDVSVEYNLSIDTSILENYPNIYFSIKDLDINETIVSNQYSGVINLNDSNRIKTLQISIVWDDIDEYDESDTSLIGKNLDFIIDANFKQYIGE